MDFPADPAARLPLERVKPGLVLSLGVVDVSVPAAEAVEELLARLEPVVDERTEDDVAIATNGGFAQSADRPLMTSDEQTPSSSWWKPWPVATGATRSDRRDRRLAVIMCHRAPEMTPNGTR